MDWDYNGLDKACRKGLLIAFAVTVFLSVFSLHFYEREHVYYETQRHLNHIMCFENMISGSDIRRHREFWESYKYHY